MKKLIVTTILLLFVALNCYGFFGVHIVGTPKVDGESVSTIIETFDGALSCISGGVTNCDNTNLFSSNDNCVLNSTNGSPIGAYLLECSGSGDDIRWDTSGIEEGADGKFISFRLTLESEPTLDDVVFIRGWDASLNAVFDIGMDGNDTDGLFGMCISTYTAKSSTPFTAGNGLWVQIRHKKDTGPDNSELEFWVSANGTVGTWGTSVTANSDAAFGDVDIIRILTCVSAASNTGTYYENLKVSSSFITDATTTE